MRYRRKDTFACWKSNGDWSEMRKWVEACWGGPVDFGAPNNPDITRTPKGEFVIVTRRGQMTADIGDWLFQSTEGEILAVDAAVFERMFEPVPSPEELKEEDLRLDDSDMENAVWLSLSAAACCWEDGSGGGTYLAGAARRIGEQLISRIQAEIHTQVDAAIEAVSPLHGDVLDRKHETIPLLGKEE